MEPDILSVTTGQRENVNVRTGPSATLDLIYACHFLNGVRMRPSDAPGWASDLMERSPDLIEAVASLFVGSQDSRRTVLTFGLALDGGYVWDETPSRFIGDLPTLARDVDRAVANDEVPHMPEKLQAFVRELDSDVWPREVASVLADLWDELGTYWRTDALPSLEEAAREVEERFRDQGDVVRALPSHHFAQFEALAAEVRSESERGPLFVVPLALASAGGFHLKSADVAAVGFGLATENVHARAEAQVASVARRAKALADPTRLMLLSLLARYAESNLTVGDLARQLGVSQPTVSGHLKTLREAELVRVEREGNRSLPMLDHDAVHELLGALDDVLYRPERT